MTENVFSLTPVLIPTLTLKHNNFFKLSFFEIMDRYRRKQQSFRVFLIFYAIELQLTSRLACDTKRDLIVTLE